MTFEAMNPEDGMLQRIRSEFMEMPGLCLTVAQAGRLWNLAAAETELALQSLVEAGFLTRTEDGRFMAAQFLTRHYPEPSRLAR